MPNPNTPPSYITETYANLDDYYAVYPEADPVTDNNRFNQIVSGLGVIAVLEADPDPAIGIVTMNYRLG